jgi:hypothetical protein
VPRPTINSSVWDDHLADRPEAECVHGRLIAGK